MNRWYKRLVFRDSRQKRSKKWPGRATAWEVRATMNWPATTNVDPTKFEGYVNARGDVTVTDKIKGRVVGQASSEELDRVLLTKGARAGSLMTGEVGSHGFGTVSSGISKIKNALSGGSKINGSSNWIGSITNPRKQNEINRSNISAIASSANTFNSAVSKLESVAKSLDGITQGTSDVINGLGRAKSVLKSLFGVASVIGGIFRVLTKR